MSYKIPKTLLLSLDLLGGVPVVPLDRQGSRERGPRFKKRKPGKPGNKRAGRSR